MCEAHARGVLADVLHAAGVHPLPRDAAEAKRQGKMAIIDSGFISNVKRVTEFTGTNGKEEAVQILVAFLEGVLEANANEFPVKSELARKYLWARFEELRSLDPSTAA